MRLAREAAGDLANKKFFFHLLASTYIIYIHEKRLNLSFDSDAFSSICYAVKSAMFFLTTSPLGRRSSIVPSILKITLSNPNP